MKTPRRTLVSSCLVLLTLACSATSQSPPDRAREWLHQSAGQMGGEEKLRALSTVRFSAMGHRNLLEQSERPEGPYIVEYDQITELRDLEDDRLRQTTEMKVLNFPANKVSTTVADGVAATEFDGRSSPGSRASLQQAEETLDLGPERILLTALSAADLRAEPDTVLQSVSHHVVAFTWKNAPVRVFLNANTALPTAVEWRRPYPYDTFWSVWGDVTTRVYYSLWWLCPGGIRYPLQWDTFRNDLPDRIMTITDVSLNPQLPADSFVISTEVKAAFEKRPNLTVDDRPLGLPNQPAVEIAKDIIHIPGAWNVTLVRQADGVVVIEAPISSGYSAKVIAEAERRWPGTKIKTVISTSDAWPHIAGVREYVARGIPVYALDVNLPILQRLCSAPRASFPDALAKSPRKPDFHVVSTKTLLGDGPNRLEIYPLRGETTERQMMAYFPVHKLLYGSDAFQKTGDGSYFYPQTVWEVLHAVERENLTVSTLFMMHMGPTPWDDVGKALAKAEQAKTGN